MTGILAAKEVGAALDNAPAALGGDLMAKLSAPLVVAPPSDWAAGKAKLLIVGQETNGWGFHPDETSSVQEVWTLEGCRRVADPIEALAKAYRRFDFSENQNSNRNGPFWRAHRLLASRFEGGNYRSVLWANLAICDTCPFNPRNASVWNNLEYDEIERLCAWQKPVLLAQVEQSSANSIIFFTGPYYDYLIDRTFPDARCEPLSNVDEGSRMICRMISRHLPRSTFRTYHPNYLQMSNRWNFLDVLSENI